MSPKALHRPAHNSTAVGWTAMRLVAKATNLRFPSAIMAAAALEYLPKHYSRFTETNTEVPILYDIRQHCEFQTLSNTVHSFQSFSNWDIFSFTHSPIAWQPAVILSTRGHQTTAA